MSDSRRAAARALCHAALRRGEPLAWFEQLYADAAGDSTGVPWADLAPNPHLVAWHAESGFKFAGKECLKVGCGLGDDCEYLQSCGGIVTGFDISPSAIRWCRERFPQSRVAYTVRDLFELPPEWARRFAFVLESYTLQVLPPELRERAADCIAGVVADGGTLLVVCRARAAAEDPGKMPWPLTRGELDMFSARGLTLTRLDDVLDGETPPVRRYRAVFERR